MSCMSFSKARSYGPHVFCSRTPSTHLAVYIIFVDRSNKQHRDTPASFAFTHPILASNIMSSQAGSPPAPSGDSSLQLPPQPKKRARKEGGAAGGTSKGKGKGKAARLEGADGGDGQDGQQQRRQSLAPQSGGDGSLSRSQGASGSNAAAGPSNSNNNADERPAKKGEKRGQQKLSRKNLFAKDC